MHRILIVCSLVVALWGCATVSTAQSITTIPTVMQTTGAVSGIREQLGGQFATTPYTGPMDDMCAASVAALVRDRDLGGTGLVDNLLWDGDIRAGPDCAAAFLTAGFTLPAGTKGEAYQRVLKPGILADGRLLIGVDYGCEGQWCLGGASYFIRKGADRWVVEGDPITWIR